METVLTFLISDDWAGKTVQSFLRGNAGVSTRLLRMLKRMPEGLCRNGSHVRTIDLLQEGDVLTLRLPEDAAPAQLSSFIVPVRYEDEHVLVLDKPPFMPVHPTRNHQGDTLANAFALHLAAEGRFAAFRAVNRLDRDTSGLVAVGLNSYAAARLPQGMGKRYTAIVEGKLPERGRIDLPIRRPNPLLIHREVGEGGQPAVTHWKRLDYHNGLSLLELALETGRTHQIRVHFSHLGYPLLGDSLYGPEHPLMNRQALHCSHLCFFHPVTRKRVTVISPLPQDMQRVYNSGKSE